MKEITFVQELKYIQDAANLRLRLEPWNIDQAFGKQKGKIFYAVDTNIVKMFSDFRGKSKYGSVFYGDDVIYHEILAWALGRYIFFRLTKKYGSMLIIPPHHQEMDGVFLGIAKNAANEKEKVINLWPKLQMYLEEYKRTNNMDALISSLEKEPLDLICFVFGEDEGYTAELKRITELLRSSRLIHIERYVDRSDKELWSFPVLQDETKAEDYDTLKRLSEKWSNELFKTKSKEHSRSRILNDAEVLARLEWINDKLDGTGKRLVLISGDRSLQQAASNVFVGENRQTFADLFIREPIVFLAASDFFTAKAANEENLKHELIKWLDVFLARCEPGHSDYLRNLRNILTLNEKQGEKLVFEFQEKNLDIISQMKEKWEEFVRLAVVEYGFASKQSLQKFAERLITTEDITRIREEVEKQVAEVLRDFRKHATIAGYWSTIAHENIKEEPDKKSVLPLRGVPALRFTLQPAASLSKEICQTLRYEDIIKQKVSFDDLTKEDPSGYTAFVLYALAFGAAGRWHVTRTLSEHALHIAEHEAHKFLIPDGHEPVTGNEAAYLLCWSIRHSAKTTAQLLEAQWYLQQAAQRKVKATGKRDDEDDIRYKSESIALDMTYNLFKLFSGETISDNISTLAQCQERALALLKRVEQDEYEEEYIKLVVKRQALAYLFCALLLREFKNNENIADQKKKEILQWLPYFEDILEKKPQSTLTCFTLLIYLVACYRYGREEQREECKLKAKEALSWERVRRCYVMPYDEKLYDFLLKLVV